MIRREFCKELPGAKNRETKNRETQYLFPYFSMLRKYFR